MRGANGGDSQKRRTAAAGADNVAAAEAKIADVVLCLVTTDGSYGRVQTDPDSEDLTILYALEPISGEPDLPVVTPPDWA